MLGRALSNARKLGDAIQALKIGLDIDPNVQRAWIDLHDVYEKKGNKDLALKTLKQAYSIGPENIEFMFVDPGDSDKDVIKKIKARHEKNKNQ